jgi:uncharacterized protein (DUF488 family)
MKARALPTQPAVYTVGHSTRSLDDFVVLLRVYGIERLVDVRTIPRSRHNPQFNYDALGPFLRNRRIGYRHLKELGGLRHARPDSPNAGWHNASFRGFADYMQTPEFAAAVAKLVVLAKEKTTAIMCAEALPWRCHRSLIGDSLIVRGIKVVDIYSPKYAKLHAITPMAKVNGTRVTYPAQADGGGPHAALAPASRRRDVP